MAYTLEGQLGSGTTIAKGPHNIGPKPDTVVRINVKSEDFLWTSSTNVAGVSLK